MMRVEFMKRWDREIVAKRLDAVFVFGDNLVGDGCGGQACIRYSPNAVGIPTKYFPTDETGAYFKEGVHTEQIKAIIDARFTKIWEQFMLGKIIVFPEDGLGTGLARLPQSAPAIYAHICKWVDFFVAIGGEE
jgi:hypothetical protein